MCGLVGIVGQIGFREKKLFNLLLNLDTIRGHHSTGIVAVNKKGETEFVKAIGTPWDLRREEADAYKKVVENRHDLIALMGHNRYATQGAINADNAHPFDFEGLIGMHNGTLERPSFNKLNEDYNYVVDSQAMLHYISDYGVEEAYKKMAGAWSVVWWDKKDSSFNFIRNANRPLEYAHINDGKTLIYASLGWMIDSACEELDILIKDDNIYNTPTNKLGWIPIENINEGKSKFHFTRELEEWTPVVSTYYSGFYAGTNYTDKKKEELDNLFKGKIIPFSVDHFDEKKKQIIGCYLYDGVEVKVFPTKNEWAELMLDYQHNHFFYGEVVCAIASTVDGKTVHSLIIAKNTISEPIDWMEISTDSMKNIENGDEVYDTFDEFFNYMSTSDDDEEAPFDEEVLNDEIPFDGKEPEADNIIPFSEKVKDLTEVLLNQNEQPSLGLTPLTDKSGKSSQDMDVLSVEPTQTSWIGNVYTGFRGISSSVFNALANMKASSAGK